ncbi:MAG TPA: hypothetical protein VGF08_07715 [Terriglobales bacterium]
MMTRIESGGTLGVGFGEILMTLRPKDRDTREEKGQASGSGPTIPAEDKAVGITVGIMFVAGILLLLRRLARQRRRSRHLHRRRVPHAPIK